LAVPAVVGNRLVGQIAVADSWRNYTSSDGQVLQRLAAYYALAMDRKRFEDALQEARDALEIRVEERTAELTAANERLSLEISTRKTAEQALRRRKQTLRALLDATTDAAFLADARGTILACNAELARRFGCRGPQGLVGRVVYEILPAELSEARRRRLEEVWRSGNPIRFEDARAGLVLDNTFYPVRDENGEVRQIAVFSRDVTENKRMERALVESEKRFRSLVENASVGICMVSEERISFHSPEFARLFELSDESLQLGDLLDRFHSEDKEEAEEFLRGRCDTSDERREADLRFYPFGSGKKEDALRWAKFRANLLESEDSRTVLVTAMDMTHAKHMEHLVLVREKMASLGHVAAGIAHEIRNPISGINIFLDTILDGFEDPENASEVKEMIGEAQAAAERVEAVIRRVLDFAKPGRPRLAHGDVNEAVENAVGLCAVTLRKTGVQIEKELAEGLPLLPVDMQALEQVILNLITNAAEALQGHWGPKRVGVVSGSDGESVFVEVADSGPGVPPELRTRIFDPFFSTKAHGTGIGLGLSHRIIRDHEGTLEVSASEWGGARFTFRIPVEK
jgi:PAS domain S-box-containing protein